MNLMMRLRLILLIRATILNNGARPLRRTIQNEIEDVMAEKILEGSIKAGNKVLVTVKDGKLNFSCKRGHNRNIHK